ncbi:MAG: CoA transferase [Chloroflexi bacterium]|nr:CoA transferase [Chloroflexota bacterium]
MTLFSSLTVLSIEQATTLPYMTLRLAEEGARVIRVENPPYGDPNRWIGPTVLADTSGSEKGMNAYFLPNNLGKESITLNLGTEDGRSLLHQLVRDLPVDIFATNNRARSYQKLGIDYETLSAIKPDLIWLGTTGFGPNVDEAAYDPILQARAGWMDLTGDPNDDPHVFGLPMADLGAGEHAYGQVMKALYRRAVTGEGCRIDISMLQSAVSWMVSPVLLAHSFDIPVTRRGHTHQFFAPVSVLATADDLVYISVGNDRQWEALTQLPGFESLARPEYATNAGRIGDKEQFYEAFTAVLNTISTDDLIAHCKQIGVAVSRINRLPNVCADPLVAANLVHARDPRTGTEIAITPPPVISDHLRGRELTLPFPPRLGEHNEQVFGALGHNPVALKAKGII